MATGLLYKSPNLVIFLQKHSSILQTTRPILGLFVPNFHADSKFGKKLEIEKKINEIWPIIWELKDVADKSVANMYSKISCYYVWKMVEP